MYKWTEAKFEALRRFITAADIDHLITASADYDQQHGTIIPGGNKT